MPSTVPAMASVFLEHPSSLEHDTGGHPEQPARITAIQRELDRRGWLGFERVRSPAVEREVLAAVHPAPYVDAIEALSARGGGAIDLDTVASAGSFDAALHAAGGAVRMVEMLLDGEAERAFSAHRPPGHHAIPTRAMGFCLFNNIAVATRYALDARGLDRVMIVDWDVHHGNGTNDIFHSTNAVLFVSIHQWPLYPGSGAASDVGAGAGEGFTVNLPVPPGAGDDEYRSLVDRIVVPLARDYRPQLMLISAGYDAHRDDPLADCLVTDAGYAAMTRSIRGVADSIGAPLGCVLEGGYALGALGRSVAATIAALAESDRAAPDEPIANGAIAEEARARLSPWWPSLA
jgi:acetoin utilization deacetylase AcuC-like enzyme